MSSHAWAHETTEDSAELPKVAREQVAGWRTLHAALRDDQTSTRVAGQWWVVEGHGQRGRNCIF